MILNKGYTYNNIAMGKFWEFVTLASQQKEPEQINKILSDKKEFVFEAITALKLALHDFEQFETRFKQGIEGG